MEKPLWMICVTHMFLETYLLVQVALIPVITREFQLSLLEASLVATVPSLFTLLMNIPSGFLADRFSTNHLLFASMLIEGLSALLISQTYNFWMLVLGVSLMKIASRIYHISGLSQISRFAKPERMGRSIGFQNALGSLGSAAGVVSLAVFLSTLGWRWSYLFWAFPILIWGFILLRSPQLKTKPTDKTEIEKQERLMKLSLIFSAPLLIFLVAIGIREVGSTGISTFMTTYFVSTRGLSESTASLIFGLGPFMGIVGSLAGGYMTERTGAKKALSWAVLGCVVSLSILSLMTHVYLLVLVYLVYALFSNSLWSPMNTIVAAITPESERGLSYSIYFFTEGLIASFTPTLVAGVIELSDVWFVFPFSIIFMIMGLIILQLLPKPKKQV
ncbi:MAG: MFS transporter [Candidatus Bathyarchaeota archaeon]|nr:MFS transporter [Candidatus Bathyarchaeota archaeon]